MQGLTPLGPLWDPYGFDGKAAFSSSILPLGSFGRPPGAATLDRMFRLLKRLLLPGFVALVAVLGTAGWFLREPLVAAWQRAGEPLLTLDHPARRPDPQRYETLKLEAERWRKQLRKQYQEASSDAQREAVVGEARQFLERLLPDMMRCWLGTPWDFHGTSETPGKGKIACGYFVATVLRDAGFRVDRYRLARQPSQNILRTFLPRSELDLQVGVSYENFADSLRRQEPGIRIIGLDTHVAFLVVEPGGFRFIHSSGSDPWCVVDEDEAAAEVLRRSNYRVHGSLTGNRAVIVDWLKGRRLKVPT